MTHLHEVDHVISQGTLRCGGFRVEYYTTTPAPDQWTAIGVLFTPQDELPLMNGSRLMVGKGLCERSSIADLQNTFARTLSQVRESCEIATEVFADNTMPISGDHPEQT
jgi:hypothetical protein